MAAPAVAASTSFCVCGCGLAVEHVPSQLTHRYYATATCAARALAVRLGYVSRVGAANAAPTHAQEGTTMSTSTKAKATKKATAKKAPKELVLDDYMKEKLAVQGRCAIGKTFTYQGINKAFKGKKVEVTGHENKGGIFIKLGDKTLTCSPFALLGRPEKPKKAAAPKAAKAAPKAAETAAPKAAKAKAAGKPKAAPKSPEKAAPAPQAAPAPAPEAAPAPAKAKAAKSKKAA